ncbi:pilus assembly protein MshP [Stutzerimonas zhaodongensis]|jgi:MSHA biogenesis protein MshP|uniref:Pilus assembly protein MshP n=1 Tax=Stutzerimonas zhaodongensis TaxID=1176257 RepID=A0A365PXM4_9GAMM|nr:pilus assembly protein MshP [Stutzerimonas zhaodongensis]RBA60949.1 pilus assembly protein MshP [Stutzerimonas zhaodongensis]
MRPDLSLLRSRQGGFGLVAAMFVIVVVAGAVVAMSRMSEIQSSTSSMAIQQVRAYQAARAGLEWGIARVLAKQSPEASFSLDGFDVKVEEPKPLTDAGLIQEEDNNVRFRQISATAQYATEGSPDYVYRKLAAVVEVP